MTDDPDSLVRAVAAAPAVSPPKQLACALVARAARPDVQRLRALLASLDGNLEYPSDDTAVLTTLGSSLDGGAVFRVAEYALEVCRTLASARIGIATERLDAPGFALDTMRVRAASLMGACSGDKPVRIDAETAGMLASRFATAEDSSGVTLVGKRDAIRDNGISRDASNPEWTVERALGEERRINADRLLTIVAFLLVPCVVIAWWLSRGPVPQEKLVLPLWTSWLVVAIARVIVIRKKPFLASYLLYSALFSDIPMYFAIKFRLLQTAPQPLFVAASTLTICAVIASLTQFLMRPRLTVGAAVVLIAGVTSFFAYVGEWFRSAWAVTDIGVVAAAAIYAQSRTRALMRRAVEAAATRIRDVEAANREVRALNEELRRQVADRSRKLAEALARIAAAPRSAMRIAAGDVIDDRYRVVGLLGRGGMGQVHEVERLADGRRLALKVLTGVVDESAVARFAREAQIAAELDHPGVVAALDVGVTRAGSLFVVMELVSGTSLAAERARFGDPTWALPILRQVASALAVMHARGVIHRDLKPSNVLLDGDTAKVSDFGLASVIGVVDSVSAHAATAAALTRAGAMMGTPLYMAPELADGARASDKSDVFSFGVLAYELLAGRLPHAVPPILERMAGRALASPASLQDSTPDLRAEIVRLVHGCLHEDPDRRPTAQTIADAL
ncbi:MAG TPA: serine/threonine-protein kinase [Polyangia bacterium]|nr:serine/threonine-protein kinase [Polyangia bacterium]